MTEDGEIMKHAILIVGFDRDEDEHTNFWWIKNSHGETWGINGYGKIARDSSLPAEGEVNLRRQLIFCTHIPILKA